MSRRTNILSVAAFCCLLSWVGRATAQAAGGATGGARPDGGQIPADPFMATRLSWQEALKKETGIWKGMPERPKDRAKLREWTNVHGYLRKAQFLRKRYMPSAQVLEMYQQELANAEQALSMCSARGRPKLVTGKREETYYSENDGSYQLFFRFLPKSAGERKNLPLIVYLHGYAGFLNIANWIQLPPNLFEFAEEAGFCVAAPFARSNTDFQGIGEQDVLNVISEMHERYGVDRERIILLGFSMGGMGAWTMGAHFPHLFAGLLIVSGRGDYYFWQKVRREDLPSYKQRLVDAEFGYSLLPNLTHTPVFCLHGEFDALIPIREARHMIAAVRKVNPAVKYVEIEGGLHWILEESLDRADVREWILARRRPRPTQFDFRSYDERFLRSHWVEAGEFARSSKPYVISASVEKGVAVISVGGAGSVSVLDTEMPEAARSLPVRADGLSVARRSGVPGVRMRVPPVGPVKNAFLSSFIFVSAGKNAALKDKRLAGAMEDWYAYAKAAPRAAAEPTVTREQLRAHNVFLFGEPEDSALMGEVLKSAPLKITVVGGEGFPRKGNGLCFVYRSPWNPAKLAVVQSGLPWGRALPENHKYDLLPDYIVYTPETDGDGSNTALCAGFFDEKWHLSGELMYVRDEKNERGEGDSGQRIRNGVRPTSR